MCDCLISESQFSSSDSFLHLGYAAINTRNCYEILVVCFFSSIRSVTFFSILTILSVNFCTVLWSLASLGWVSAYSYSSIIFLSLHILNSSSVISAISAYFRAFAGKVMWLSGRKKPLWLFELSGFLYWFILILWAYLPSVFEVADLWMVFFFFYSLSWVWGFDCGIIRWIWPTGFISGRFLGCQHSAPNY